MNFQIVIWCFVYFVPWLAPCFVQLPCHFVVLFYFVLWVQASTHKYTSLKVNLYFEKKTFFILGFPITCRAPSNTILVGANGVITASDVQTLSNACINRNFRGIMIWYGSVKNGFAYGPEADTSKSATSAQAFGSALTSFQTFNGWSKMIIVCWYELDLNTILLIGYLIVGFHYKCVFMTMIKRVVVYEQPLSNNLCHDFCVFFDSLLNMKDHHKSGIFPNAWKVISMLLKLNKILLSPQSGKRW